MRVDLKIEVRIGFGLGTSGVALRSAPVNVLEQQFRLPHRVGQNGAKSWSRILIEKHQARRSDESGAKGDGLFFGVVHGGESSIFAFSSPHKISRRKPRRENQSDEGRYPRELFQR